MLKGFKMKQKYLCLLATCCLSLSLGGAASADEVQLQPQPTSKTVVVTDIYIVQLEGDPVLAYDGGIRGYKATKPGKGKKINPNSAHVKKICGTFGAAAGPSDP